MAASKLGAILLCLLFVCLFVYFVLFWFGSKGGEKGGRSGEKSRKGTSRTGARDQRFSTVALPGPEVGLCSPLGRGFVFNTAFGVRISRAFKKRRSGLLGNFVFGIFFFFTIENCADKTPKQML